MESRVIPCLAVLCCLALGVQSAGGDQYRVARTYIQSMKLKDTDLKDAFAGLDVNKNEEINLDDLSSLFWYSEATFAKSKFLRLLNMDANPSITPNDLNKFLEKEASILATIECTYVKSKTLRESCYADQLLTYIYLVLETANVKEFYNELDSTKNQVVDVNDIDFLKEYGLKDKENFMEELGGNDDGTITLEEFEKYVTQEDICDDFRRCRGPLDTAGGTTTYSVDCLMTELVDYVENDLTEIDIAMAFKLLDTSGKGIGKTSLLSIKDCDENLANSIITLFDLNKNGYIDYEEFRTYLRSPTVRLQLERQCTEDKDTQSEQLHCIKHMVITLFLELHKPVWLRVPDLDMLFTFEKIDTNDDGLIMVDKDLISWPETVKMRFLEEVDSVDVNRDINLEEFNEYMHIPHIVFGVGDCMLHPKKNSDVRVSCYVSELAEVLTNMLSTEQINNFFEYYNTDKYEDYLTFTELRPGFETDEQVRYFLSEVGTGDRFVTRFDFHWYVKQQELSEMYKDKKDNPAALHYVLADYQDNRMTEYDIQETFSALDTSGNMELDQDDWPNHDRWPEVYESIDSVTDDRDNTGNFNEFWLWLLTEKDSRTRKRHLEVSCAITQKVFYKEILCYRDRVLSGDLCPTQ